MTATNRLTTLERVRDYVGVTSNNDDIVLARLIEETSRFILSYLQRPTLFQYIFSDIYDGAGRQVQLLRHYPVLNVSLVMVDGVIVPASASSGASGYRLESWEGLPPGRPQAISVSGYVFNRGHSNINIVYTTGYVINGEVQTVPAGSAYSIAVSAPYGSFGADQGVTYASGNALAKVTANPAQGQYYANDGMYGFSAADSGVSVKISYSYVPSDIEQACTALVGERYRYKNRIGEITKTLGGQETVSFSQRAMPEFVRELLQPYRRVVAL